MKAERSLFGILTFLAMHTLVVAASEALSGDAGAALKHAGGNRSELEAALREMKGIDGVSPKSQTLIHARVHHLTLVTCDRKLIASPHVKTLSTR